MPKTSTWGSGQSIAVAVILCVFVFAGACRSVATGSRFDRELWSNGLSPVLNLWKKLNQGSTLIHQKVEPPTEGQKSPILSFIALEQFNAIRLVQ
ncbi:Cytoplasmic dynein 2 heavy chain 1, partial [Characodon lateralis]|nr:Cytoplasmic dynein 2 heavy chain 1 [Characodon lateralis]